MSVTTLSFLNILQALFLNLVGLQINDIEPFCQDEIALYKQCAERRVRPLLYVTDILFFVLNSFSIPLLHFTTSTHILSVVDGILGSEVNC